MGCSSDKHPKDIHECVEKIVNTHRQRMDELAPRIQRSPHIALVCRDVNRILDDVIKRAAYHNGHKVKWHSSVFEESHVLTCETCGKHFENKVIEAAKKLKKL